MRERKCPECGMPAGQWTRNAGRGVSREGIVYCCQGCAQKDQCVCRDDPRPRSRALALSRRRRKVLSPEPLEGRTPAGGAESPLVLDLQE